VRRIRQTAAAGRASRIVARRAVGAGDGLRAMRDTFWQRSGGMWLGVAAPFTLIGSGT
jgi:hypothetical protein